MKCPIKCIINNQEIETSLPPGTVVLDFLRLHQHLPGTKEGCREGECGACTVLLGELTPGGLKYKAVASCLLPLGEIHGKHVVTIEGLNQETLTPVQQALVNQGAIQCGFCTPGIVMSLTGFFLNSPTLSPSDALDALDGNLCRCTGYVSIQRAIQDLYTTYTPRLDQAQDRIKQLVEWSILPGYFSEIAGRLAALGVTFDEKEEPARHRHRILVAGGTDLYIQQPDTLPEEDLDFISHYPDLAVIRRVNNWMFIGAGVTIETLKESPLIQEAFPGIENYLKLVSSTIMRNRATVAGNIVNASPIGDLSILLLGLDADIALQSRKGKRQLPLRDFFKGYKKLDMKKDEIIEAIEIPICPWGGEWSFHFEKVSQRHHLDIASCNSAISLRLFEDRIREIHISAGGVAPIPLYLEKTCEFLIGKPVLTNNIREAVQIMAGEIAPISDVRGSAAYKTKLLGNLIYAHFLTLFPNNDLTLP